MNIAHSDQLLDVVARGGIVYCSHSGGKDSQAMYAALRRYVPHDQLVVVHADLGRVEWDGVQDHIRATISHPLNVVSAVFADGSPKDLLGMVKRRAATRPDAPPWPSSAARFCTSDLKRDPIAKFIRADLKARGKTLAINATGIRAEESAARAKQASWSLNARLSKAGREVYDHHPIAEWSTAQVFAQIANVGQQPFHAYANGNERLSCVFCILGCAGDLARGAQARPELLAEYQALEAETGYTMFGKASLADRIATVEVI